jgi:hypothetical protein
VSDLRSRLFGCTLAASALILCGVITFWWKDRNWPHQFVPTGLNVGELVYRAEENWGFGPGGNETGVFVYELSPDVPRRLADPKFVSSLGRVARTEWRGQYGDWHATPARWPLDENCEADARTERCNGKASMRGYLGRYGFDIPVDDKYADLIDAAIARPGSYYAYGRTGIFVILPRERRAAYLYAG